MQYYLSVLYIIAFFLALIWIVGQAVLITRREVLPGWTKGPQTGNRFKAYFWFRCFWFTVIFCGILILGSRLDLILVTPAIGWVLGLWGLTLFCGSGLVASLYDHLLDWLTARRQTSTEESVPSGQLEDG